MAHGDIKLDNIVFTNEIGLALIDFGKSSVINDVRDTPDGTENYMAPEVLQSRHEKINWSVEKADIFSLGVSLFMMMTLCPPFEKADLSCPDYARMRKNFDKFVQGFGLGHA